MVAGFSLFELVGVAFASVLTVFWTSMLCSAAANARLTPEQRTFWIALMVLTHAFGALSYLVNRSAFEREARVASRRG
jgi:uncharacterized DUF497 family protein